MYKQVQSLLSGMLSHGVSMRGAESGFDAAAEFRADRHIRLLTFNIQVGIQTSSYRHYITRSWQHLLPHAMRNENLDKISTLLSQYDVVALQEADGGSLRSGFVNQVQYLAESSGFPYWYQQLNRNLGRVAQHSNGLLSRYRPLDVEGHRLPGLLPGRGAIIARFGDPADPLVLVVMHLALGESAQNKQLAYVRELIEPYRHIVLMGDMNAHAHQLLNVSPLSGMGLLPLPGLANSFPSWRPEKALDHILVSPTLTVKGAAVLPFSMSDHLPIALDVLLPEGYLAAV